MAPDPRDLELDLDRRDVLALAGTGLGGGVVWNATQGSVSGQVTGPSNRPDASDDDIAAYTRSNAGFGLDLLATLADEDPEANRMVSPLSVSGALAMTWDGARGETADRMRETLHFSQGRPDLHATVGALQYDLNQRAEDVPSFEVPQFWRTNRFELSVANALWTQTGYPFRESFLDTGERYYGGGVRSVDFKGAPDASRRRINDWGASATNGRIDEIIPRDFERTRRVRIVLTNAVYLLADWEKPFDPEETDDGEFTAIDGSTHRVPMMEQTEEFRHLADYGAGYQVVELPYVGEDLSMVILLYKDRRAEDEPTYESFEEFERSIDADWLLARFDELDATDTGEIELTMPRFEFETELRLSDPLEELGMTTAFQDSTANFEGMVQSDADVPPLFLFEVFHDTYVDVDEEGTEAAAVSAPVGGMVSGPLRVTVDRPFLFCIRDRETNAVLFLGRVVDAAAME